MPVLAEPSRRFAALGLAAAAAVQAVAAVLFFYAANWWSLAPALKVAGLDLLLLLCALGAVMSPPDGFARSTWATAGAVLSGVLFGVHGQIWQTGADAWELFALWSGLAVVWAVAARSDAAWLVAALTATAALWRWLSAVAPADLLPDHWYLTVSAGVPVVVGGLWLAQGRRGGWLPPLLLAMTAGLLGGGSLSFHHSEMPLLVALAAAALTVGVAPPRRCGPWPATIALLLAVVVAEAWLMWRLIDNPGMGIGIGNDAELGLRMLLVALLMVGGLLALVTGVRRLFNLGGVLPPGMVERVLSLAVGVGGWIAMGMAAGAVFMFTTVLPDYEHAWPLMATAAGAAAATMRGRGLFLRHLHAACVFIAYGAALGEVAVANSGMTEVAVASWVLLPVVAWATREGAAGAMATVVAVALAALRIHDTDYEAVAVFAAVLAVPGWLCVGRERPSVRAGGMVMLVACFLVPTALEFDRPQIFWICRGAAVAAAVGLLGALLIHREDMRGPRLLGGAGFLLAGSLLVPAGAAGLVGLGAVSARLGSRLPALLGIAVAGWSVVRFYYLLEVPLDRKAAYLAAGAALAAIGWLLAHGRPHVPKPQRLAALMLLAAVLPAAVEAWDGLRKGRVVAEGRLVLVPLRPVDPRSLIQGDYMALAYDVRLLENLSERGGLAALRLDDQKVAVAARPIAAADQSAPDEVVLKVGPGRREPRLGPDSFLFQEGTGPDWARARYAAMRVLNGDVVMTTLMDARGNAIVPVVRPRIPDDAVSPDAVDNEELK